MGNAKIKNDLKGTKNVVQLKDTLAILFSSCFDNENTTKKMTVCHKKSTLVTKEWSW